MKDDSFVSLPILMLVFGLPHLGLIQGVLFPGALSLCTGGGVWTVIWRATWRPWKVTSFSIRVFTCFSHGSGGTDSPGQLQLNP